MKASPFKVGTFILAGVTTVVAVILLLGAGRWFSRRVPFILYFAESVHGLTVGSPVKFKGVPIGTVKRIQVALQAGQGTQRIPVLIEVNENVILTPSGEQVNIRDARFVREQIQRGLRGSLELESLITGNLYVQLDYYPSAPPPVFMEPSNHYLELPTISTGLSEFISSLERVDLARLSRRAEAILDRLDRLLGDLQVGEISQRLTRALDSLDKLLNAPELKNTLRSITQTSDETRKLVQDLRTEVRPVAGSLTNATAEATRALAEMRAMLVTLRTLIEPNSPFVADISAALDQLSDAARSVRLLSDYLARNPGALLGGRKTPKTRP